MDNSFEAADSGDVLAHPRITNTQTFSSLSPLKLIYSSDLFVRQNVVKSLNHICVDWTNLKLKLFDHKKHHLWDILCKFLLLM